MDTLKNNKPTYSLNCKGKLLLLDTSKVMAILNTTPDSFFDGGRFKHVDNALEHAEKMLNEGADILDVGGYSSRPGATAISIDEELNRVMPVIEAVNKQFPNTIISIDTFRAKVAKEAIAAGAAMVNDISAGDDDEAMLPFIVESNVPYIIMHKQGTPQTMQQNPAYEDVLQEVIKYLSAKVSWLRDNGVYDIVIDPGFGFGKTVAHNYKLLKHLDAFKILGVPILAGLSRKSMINKVIDTKAAQALNGTTTLNTIALLNGANILRVHDVKEAKEVAMLIAYYKNIE